METWSVSWYYWNGRFHRDPAILGRRIFVGDVPKTIIGVAPRAYTGPRVGVRTSIWMPREKDQVTMLGRLKPGITLERAQAEMSVLFRFTQAQRAGRSKDPLVWQTKVEVEPAGAGLARVRDQYGKPLALLMAVVSLLLLLACINMASMLLARSAGRQREMAVRVGVGASRGNLVRQMLTESVILSGAGALFGVLLAYFGTGILVRIMASGRAHERVDIGVEPDLHVLLFTAGIALLTGLLFGLAPAWYAFRSSAASHLRHSGRAGDTWFWRLFGKGLVAAQVALSILLVTAAAVFLGHLERLRNLDLGFRSDHVLLVVLDPARSGYRRELYRYVDRLVRRQRFQGCCGERSGRSEGRQLHCQNPPARAHLYRGVIHAEVVQRCRDAERNARISRHGFRSGEWRAPAKYRQGIGERLYEPRLPELAAGHPGKVRRQGHPYCRTDA
jgi:hypothetical protein